jgi:acetyl esterase/lipase
VTTVVIDEPKDIFERAKAGFLRGFLRCTFRPLVGPPFSAAFQRRWVNLLTLLTPTQGSVLRYRAMAASVSVEITVARCGEASGAVLFIHGGAFCLGSPVMYRSVTAHLAGESRMPVWAPDYRLAPENPYPAALDDVLCTYREMLCQGYAAEHIVIAGDSAGGSLALALAIRLRNMNAPRPGGLILLSPFTDLTLCGDSLTQAAADDPVLRRGWLEQAVGWYQCPPGTPEHSPLQTDLTGLPPMLIQAGDQELLCSDSTRLADHATRCHVDCRLEIYRGRWHVFQLQSFYLRSSVAALQTLAAFALSTTRSPC